MKVAGIICEYNPFHLAHTFHISETRRMLGEESAVVCVMSGNFVQRGDFAMFAKHVRAAAAVHCGADLVLELPVAYVLSSAERFAFGGVALLDSLGIVTHLSFGSEAGEISPLSDVADCLMSPEINSLILEELSGGKSYAAARQKAAEVLIGDKARLLECPNNILGIEYLKAIRSLPADLIPVTVRREGAGHDDSKAMEYASASLLRKMILSGDNPWGYIPEAAGKLFRNEIKKGRAPVTAAGCEQAVLARLRTIEKEDFEALPDASEGLHRRLMRFARTEATLSDIAAQTKSKRYAMSRIRRMLFCAYLGIKGEDSLLPPPYARVLAFNKKGQRLLKESAAKSDLPVITKPASAKRLDGRAKNMFVKEATSTDLYVLGYPKTDCRTGGQEFVTSPVKV